jgi:6-phosphogluconate dehydrogenase (decarboxylating)
VVVVLVGGHVVVLPLFEVVTEGQLLQLRLSLQQYEARTWQVCSRVHCCVEGRWVTKDAHEIGCVRLAVSQAFAVRAGPRAANLIRGRFKNSLTHCFHGVRAGS